MNYMNEVAKLLGVEFEEIFRLRVNKTLDGQPRMKDREYKLTPEGLFVAMDPNKGTGYTKATNSLTQILNGNYSIIKLPWTPKIKETYYFIDCEGFINPALWGDDPDDITHYKTGNCFQTRAEAGRNADAYLQWIKSEPIVDWRTES